MRMPEDILNYRHPHEFIESVLKKYIYKAHLRVGFDNETGIYSGKPVTAVQQKQPKARKWGNNTGSH